MQAAFPLLFAALVGFTHALEADHLLAVSSMVTRRTSLRLAVRDGIAWGLGHTSTIVLIGLLMIALRVGITEGVFHWFEAAVGLMLLGLGVWRLYKVLKHRRLHQNHIEHDHSHDHKMAYGVGLVHGLAGSGGLVLLVMTQMTGQMEALSYLFIFGLGSVVGMALASSIFHLPFSRRVASSMALQLGLTVLSSALCMGFGAKLVYENLLA